MSDQDENLGDDLSEDFDEEKFFEEFETGGGFKDLLRSNPLVKIGMVLGGFATIIGGIILFGGSDAPTPVSVMKGASDVTEVPGEGEVSQTYREAVEQSNVQAVETALREGGSALPVPVSPPVGKITLEKNAVEEEDPLERWRRIQEEREQREQEQKQKISIEQPLLQTDPDLEAVNSLADAMATQMESILSAIELAKPQHVVVTNEGYLEAKAQEQQAAAQQAAQQAGLTAAQAQQVLDIILPAGTVEYAKLIVEANSDVKGPILAQLVSGPLAGSRLLGTFEEREELLILNFNTVVVDGISHQIEAVAINPETANTGLATEVDQRYFKRVILPAAAAFIEGMGSAIADTGNTSVSVQGETVTSSENDLDAKEELFKGVETAAKKIGEVLDRQDNQVRPLIRVAAGTPIGVMFMKPVTEQTQ